MNGCMHENTYIFLYNNIYIYIYIYIYMYVYIHFKEKTIRIERILRVGLVLCVAVAAVVCVWECAIFRFEFTELFRSNSGNLPIF